MKDLLILCYHAVSDRWQGSLSVSPACLERQIGLILARGYRGATFSEALRGPRPQKTLVVSFDDAYASTLLAAPVLARLGVPGTVFVPTGFVDNPGPMSWPGIDCWLGSEHEAELTCMTWDELAGLAERGWEVGAHSISHPDLTELGDAELERELTAPRELLGDRLDRPCEAIAYPYGLCDTRVVGAAARSGYGAGATLTRWPHAPHPLAWPRVGAYESREWSFRLKTLAGLRRPIGLLHGNPGGGGATSG